MFYSSVKFFRNGWPVNKKGLKITRNINLIDQVYSLDNITIKSLSYNQLLNTANRLTRFENPIKKNLTVAKALFTKNTISPKITSKVFAGLLPATIDSLTESMWNTSLINLGYHTKSDYLLNLYLAYEDIKIFSASECLKELFLSGRSIKLEHPIAINRFTDLKNADENTINELKSLIKDNGFKLDFLDSNYIKRLNVLEQLYIAYKLSYPVNYTGFLKMLADNTETYNDLPVAIQRLIELNKLVNKFKNEIPEDEFLPGVYELAFSLRKKLDISYPPSVVFLVEGITEEILLPKFAECMNYNFNADGIHIISAGGKNQVGKLYNKFKRQLNIPIAILLDADAEEIYNEINTTLRDGDKLISIQRGEFEDLLPKELICMAVNKDYMLSPNLKLSEIDQDKPIVKQLNIIWKEFGLGEFNKSQFANTIFNNIDDSKYISDEMQTIIKEIHAII